VEVETVVSEGAVGEGELALRITQLLGPPRLEVPEHEQPKAAPPPPPPPAPITTPAPSPRAFLVAITAGLGFSSDLPEPLPVAGLSARRRLVGPLSLEASGALTLGASWLETSGGSVDVSAEQITLHMSFDPLRNAELGLSLGLGGGLVWMQGKGEAREGFSGTSDSTLVALLSARATAFFTHNNWSLLVGVEPGVMLPAVSIGSGSNAARLGRPWTTTSIGLGYAF
jgi:hypothetical protein